MEACGVFDINITSVTADDAGQTTYDIEYSTDGGANWIMGAAGNALPFAADIPLDVNLTADGTTMVMVRFVDGVDPACNDEFGPLTAPPANSPLIIQYPAN